MAVLARVVVAQEETESGGWVTVDPGGHGESLDFMLGMVGFHIRTTDSSLDVGSLGLTLA